MYLLVLVLLLTLTVVVAFRPHVSRSVPFVTAVRFKQISPSTAFSSLQKDPTIVYLDVRTPAEYEAYHVKDSVLLPLFMPSGYGLEQVDPSLFEEVSR